MASAPAKRLATKLGVSKGASGKGAKAGGLTNAQQKARAERGGETDAPPPPENISADIASAILWCEEEADRLRVGYERYFLGVDRTPPDQQRVIWRRTVTRLMESKLQNTAVRFKITQIRERMRTYERYWGRILKEIEDGTYSRHLFKAKLHVRNEAAVGEAARLGLGSGAGGPPPPPQFDDVTQPNAVPPPLPRRPASALSEDAIRHVYDTYVDARRKTGENTANVNYDSFAASLRKQVPAILEQHKANAVEFKISIRDGRAVLRVVPRS